MKKEMVSVTLFILCALVLSCGTSGGGGASSAAGAAAGTGEVFYGNWSWEPSDDSGDGGSSTITMTEAEEVIDGQTVKTYTLSGEVTAQFEWGGCVWEIVPADAATLEKLRKTTAISFKAVGDGNHYFAQLPTPAVTDWGFHQRTINTTAGEVQEHNLILRTFTQPGWAAQKRLDTDTIEKFKMCTFNADQGANVGPYTIKIWDLKLHL